MRDAAADLLPLLEKYEQSWVQRLRQHLLAADNTFPNSGNNSANTASSMLGQRISSPKERTCRTTSRRPAEDTNSWTP
ncbi:MAG: hypothetical protein AVDCRST_MAG75-552 [uncultured Propionibacteriaceae bacterium]|uniref:Uncharacterized protein n=1 Tax=uncultured Propionibacteriaceae bacterium TaxID=257457 RepID=A0A6J4N2X2_9ACTN|nr:MAG: hypothetical protein AVDCRST_MAG75-552 [uncultured Propionibacteriaceae bacterium]